MDEEDQAAAKAAAKKAKKERQKAKKLLSPAKPVTNAQAATASAKVNPDSGNNSFQLEHEFNQLALSPSTAGDLLSGLPDHAPPDKDLQHSSTPGSNAFASSVGDILSATASSHGVFPTDSSSVAVHDSYSMSSHADTAGAHSQQMASSTAWVEGVDGTDKPVGSPFEEPHFLQSLFCCPLTQVRAKC